MSVVALDPDLVASVARRMRASDRDEIEALCWWGTEAPRALAEEAVMRSRFGGVVLDSSGEPQAAIGLVPIWPGVFSAWMFGTDAWPSVWRSTWRFARAILIPGAAASGGHRLQAFSGVDHDDAHRFLASLGFANEGTARAFGRQRQDFIMFGAVL